MPRLTQPSGRRLRARPGFSLSEMMIVLLILSIVGTALVRTMTKQQQSYRDTTKGATMRRELRLSGVVMTQDLRSISSAGGDVQEMTEQRLGFNGTYGSSIICARPAAGTIDIPPLALARHDLTVWTTTPKVGDTIFVYNDSLSGGSEDDTWQKLVIASFSTNNATCLGAPYTDAVLDAAKNRYRITVNFPAPSTKIADSVKVGAVVRFTRPMRYELFSATSGSWYLGYSEYTNGAWSSAEAVAGPFRRFVAGDGNPSGLQFRYYDSTGTRLTTSTAADRINLARIDIYTRAEGGAAAVTERKGALLTDSTLYRIGLRNDK